MRHYTNDGYVLFLIASALGLLCTWATRAAAMRLGLMSQPNPIVPQHHRPVAHLGGCGIALAAALAWVVMELANGSGFSSNPGAWAAVISGFLFLLLGMHDDLVRLSARKKLTYQLIVACFAAATGLVHPFTDWGILDFGLSVFWILTLVNAFNLTDVSDGLVAGLSAVLLFAFAHYDPSLALPALAMTGACVGFLGFNRPPASIFMGDTGSHLLGFAVAALTLMHGPVSDPTTYPIKMMLFCGVFLFELIFLVAVRRRKGLCWWQGSPDHFALRMQAAGLSRWQVNSIAWTATALLAWAAVSFGSMTPAIRALLLSGVVIFAAMAWRLLLKFEVKPAGRSDPPEPRERRLLWIHQNFVTARQAGNSRAIQTLSAFLERGWKVEVITAQHGYLDESTSRGGAEVVIENQDGLTIHRLRVPCGFHTRGRSYLAFAWRTLRYLRHVGTIDMVYASTPPLPQISVSIVASVRKCAPMILEVRDLWPPFLIQMKQMTSRTVILALEWLEALAYRYADHTVSVSPAFSTYLERMGISPTRLTIAPTGGDPVLAHAGSARGGSWRQRTNLEDRFVALYAGSFNETYGLEMVLQAAERLAKARPDVVWVFAGNGRERAMIEVAAQRFNVVYLGSLPKDHLAEVFAEADVGLVVLRNEPLLKMVAPGKLFDYLSAGLPVICTNDGLPGAIVHESGAGLVLASPIATALVEAVQTLSALSHVERRELGRKGQRWIFEHMPCAAMARRGADASEALLLHQPSKSRLLALVLSIVGATFDTATRRSSRIVRELLRSDLTTAARESLRTWLSDPKSVEDDKRPFKKMPAVLSNRTTRDEPTVPVKSPKRHDSRRRRAPSSQPRVAV